MKKLKNIFSLLVVALVGLSLAACSNDDLGTNQYQGGVSLNAYGPNPVMRGGQLRFVGSNLDQIASITIPGVGEITNIEVVKSGVPSEIRITVPKDGPQVGYVTLKTKTDQTITTKTQIEYIEGIEVTQIPEETVMPGQTIRIEGDYLNLIYSMAFADGVLVSSDDFVAQDRYYIDVVVPEDAKTGKLEFYTADLTIQRTAKEEEELTYQTIVSEDALTVGLPTTSKIASPRGEAEVEGSITAKAGEQIKLTGTYYNVVSDVTVGGVSVNDLAVAEDGTGITFTLPAEAPSGEIMLICKSGEEVPVGTLETVKPSNCTATPSPVKAGATLTIAGKDMDLVKYVAFPLNKEGYTDVTEGLDVAAEKVTVAVPETAVAGKLVLVMANIKDSVFVEYTLVKPVATSYDKKPVSAGEVLTITGTDLDLVKSVTFGESTAELEEGAVSADGTTLSVKVPMDAKSGKPKLNLVNGTSEEAPELKIEEAKFCYATKLPGDDAELKAGESFTLPVANGDKLTGVQINDEDCQFVLMKDNTELIIGIPAKAKKGAKVRLVSSNGEITYTIDFIPNTEVTTVLWTGVAVADDWGNQPYLLSDGGQELKDAGVVVGDVIGFHISPTEEAWKLQIVEGHWGPTYKSICSIGNDTESGKFTEYDLEANKGFFYLEVTQELLDAAFKAGGWGGVFVLNGDNVVVDKVITTHYESLEETLWTGEVIADDWGDQPYLLSDGGAELSEIGAKAGQTLYFYISPTEEAWKLQIVEGHWGPTYASICSLGNDTESGKFTEYDLEGNGGKYGLTLTQEMLDAAFAKGGWGGVFVLNGDNVKCTKVTIE